MDDKVDKHLILVELNLPHHQDIEIGSDSPEALRAPTVQHIDSDEHELIRLYAEGKRDFSGANLPQASLNGVCLEKARLIMANLSEAEMSAAKLNGTRLSMANLAKANLQNAELVGATLHGADVSPAAHAT